MKSLILLILYNNNEIVIPINFRYFLIFFENYYFYKLIFILFVFIIYLVRNSINLFVTDVP
jgi:hypothetical protein